MAFLLFIKSVTFEQRKLKNFPVNINLLCRVMNTLIWCTVPSLWILKLCTCISEVEENYRFLSIKLDAMLKSEVAPNFKIIFMIYAYKLCTKLSKSAQKLLRSSICLNAGLQPDFYLGRSFQKENRPFSRHKIMVCISMLKLGGLGTCSSPPFRQGIFLLNEYSSISVNKNNNFQVTSKKTSLRPAIWLTFVKISLLLATL